jgi:nicotinate-nucleotide adenylyltransferase
VNIGLFGGTFDPIHSGHLAAARAARERFQLDRVYFIPAGSPPHKNRHVPFEHRFAMVSLACAGEARFVPSAAEAPRPGRPSYSILTVRHFRREMGAEARLYFLLGADAFLTLRSWQQWRGLLRAANFIVISRPGFDLARVETVLPEPWKRRGTPREPRGLEYVMGKTSVYVLSDVWVPISATDIRAALAPRSTSAGRGAADHKLPVAVAEYIRKTGLYGGPR